VYVFRTRLPVASERIATPLLPLDLHVLSLPLAFILSQDQTLHSIKVFVLFFLHLTGKCLNKTSFLITWLFC
jgi:hypothetical protein